MDNLFICEFSKYLESNKRRDAIWDDKIIADIPIDTLLLS